MSGRSPARRATVALLALVALVAAGCGIPADSSAQRIDPEAVPFGLLDEAEAPPAPAEATGADVTVALVLDGRLVEVPRRIDPVDDLDAVVGALAAGPTTDEQELGISGALPPGEVAEVTTARGVAEVDLRASFADLGNVDQGLAIAQLVFTLTARPGIGRVGFTLDGASVEVPRGDGTLTTESLARDDFAALAPEG